MSANKTRPRRASVAAFIDALADPARRADARRLIRLLRAASGERPVLWGPSIVGFGRYHYRYASGREGEMPLIAFSPRRPATVLYVMTGFSGARSLLARLGPHSTGKSCLYVKRLADVDLKVLATLARRSLAAMRKKARA